MFRKSLIFVLLTLLVSGLFAAPKAAMLNPKGRGPAAKMAKKLERELKLTYNTVKEIKLVDANEILSSGRKKAFRACKTKVKCVEQKSKGVRKVDLIIFPRITEKNGAPKATLYFFSTKTGKRVLRKVVEGDEDTDAEDFAADIAAAIIDVAGDLPEEGAMDVSEDKPEPEVEKGLSVREMKRRLRSGFKAYKKGDTNEAVKLFREGGKDKFADDVQAIDEAVKKAQMYIKDGEFDRAAREVDGVLEKDASLRKMGYKELQFIKETKQRHRYSAPDDKDYSKAKRAFQKVKKEIRGIAGWKTKESEKLKSSMKDQLTLKDKVAGNFEKNEKKARLNEKKKERAHQKKIEKMKSDLQNLDSKYRDKISDIEREITKYNKKLEDERGYEEIYRKDIEKEQKSIRKKFRKINLGLKKSLIQSRKKYEKDVAKMEKEIEAVSKKQQKDAVTLEKRMEALRKEVEKMSAVFDRSEQKAEEDFDKKLRKEEAKDRIDRAKAEKKATKETEKLNKQIEDYDKDIQKLAQQVDKFEREISTYVEKQEQRLQKIQENTDSKREQLEQKYEGIRAKAREKAEKEYEVERSKKSKEIEKAESEVIKIEDKYPNYEKKAQWKNARKKLKTLTNKLVKFEDNYDNYVNKKIAPVNKDYKRDLAKLDTSFKTFDKKIKVEIANFKKKKNTEKKTFVKKLRLKEKGRGKFEKGIRKKITTANANRDRAMKAIDGRVGKRDKQRAAAAKKRKAVFEAKRKKSNAELIGAEKQMAASQKKTDKQRNIMSAKLEKFRIAGEKRLNGIEMSNEKKREQNEIAMEKQNQAVFLKYEKKSQTDRKKLAAKINQLEKKMKGLLGQRGNEEKRLRANIEKAEAQTDSMLAGFSAAAKKRLAANEKALANAEKKEVAAKKKYDAKLKALDKQYKSKVDSVLKRAISSNRRTGKEFKKERDRTFEYSSFTKKLLKVKADAYAAKGMKRLESDDIAEARKEFFQALYVDSNSPSAKKGLKAIDKKAKELYNKAYKLVQEDPESAKRILINLKRDLDPYSEYYLRTLALIEEAKMVD